MINGDDDSFCFFRNMSYYLSANNPVNSDVIGAVLGAYGFRYYPDNTSYEQISGIRMTFDDLLHAFLQYIKADWREEIFIEYDTLVNRTKSYGLPCLFWIDDYYLPFSIHYQESHFCRPVILTTQNSGIQIFDNNILPVRADKIIREMVEAHEIKIVFLNKFNQCFQWDKQFVEDIEFGIKCIHENFFQTDSNHGERGLFALLNYFTEENKKEMYYQLYFQMNRAGGLVKTRLNLSNVFKIIINHNLAKTERVRQCMQYFADLSEEWRMIANLIFRISQIDDDLLKQRLVQRMRQNIDRECFCFNSLIEAFGGTT